MEQGLAAMDDQLKTERANACACIAMAVRGAALLVDFLAEHAEQCQQIGPDHLLGLRPGFGRVLLPTKEEDRIAFQFGHLQRQFDLVDDRFDEFGNNGLAVGKCVNVCGHVTRIAADVRDDEHHGFRLVFTLSIHAYL